MRETKIVQNQKIKALLQFSNAPLRHFLNTSALGKNIRFGVFNTELNVLRNRWIEFKDSNSEGA